MLPMSGWKCSSAGNLSSSSGLAGTNSFFRLSVLTLVDIDDIFKNEVIKFTSILQSTTKLRSSKRNEEKVLVHPSLIQFSTQ